MKKCAENFENVHKESPKCTKNFWIASKICKIRHEIGKFTENLWSIPTSSNMGQNLEKMHQKFLKYTKYFSGNFWNTLRNSKFHTEPKKKMSQTDRSLAIFKNEKLLTYIFSVKKTVD